MIISALLIVAFTFFYSSISFDPKQQAEQLLMQGADQEAYRSGCEVHRHGKGEDRGTRRESRGDLI